MKNFKRIMLSGHTQEKSYLHKLYTDKQVYISSVKNMDISPFFSFLPEEKDREQLMERCEYKVKNMFFNAMDIILTNAYKYELWLEEIRGIDLLMAISRMRELKLI